MSTVCLAVMCKNEARTLPRLWESVKDHIDRACFLDTGSTDGTQDVIREFLTQAPGSLHESEFVDFSYSRNELLHFARQEGCDYLLLLDADHVVHWDDPDMFSHLDVDAGLIELRGALAYRMPYVLRSGVRASYKSPTHEFLNYEEPIRPAANVDGLWLEHLEDGGNRHDKFERDERLLEAEYAKDPNNQRTVFYLAQTVEHKDRDRAIELYRRRYDLGGWDEERYIALLRVARLTGAIEDWVRAWDFRPSRWEGATGLVKALHEAGLYQMAWAVVSQMLDKPRQYADILFCETDALWKFDFEAGLAAFYAGHPDVSRRCWLTVLAADDVPEDIRELTRRNLAFCD